jgi:hypothetical protein
MWAHYIQTRVDILDVNKGLGVCSHFVVIDMILTKTNLVIVYNCKKKLSPQTQPIKTSFYYLF